MARLYVKYGVPRAKLNTQTTMDLMAVYGDRFMYDLHKATGFEGDEFFGKIFKKKDKDAAGEGDAQAGAENKGGFWDKAKNFGRKAMGAISSAQAANQAGSGAAAPGPAVPEKILGMSKPMFYAVCAVALILMIYVITSSKKTSAA